MQFRGDLPPLSRLHYRQFRGQLSQLAAILLELLLYAFFFRNVANHADPTDELAVLAVERHHHMLGSEDFAVFAPHLKRGNAQIAFFLDRLQRQHAELLKRHLIHMQQPHRLPHQFLARVAEQLRGGRVAVANHARFRAHNQQAIP